MKSNELYNAMVKVYPERKRPLPLILSAWHYTSDIEKRNRFCMHLEFAISAGVAEDILKDVTEDDWYYAKK